jgi:hypothetical protein
MGKGIVVIILDKCLSALLRLESKLIVAACRDASVIRGIFRVRNVYELGKFEVFHLWTHILWYNVQVFLSLEFWCAQKTAILTIVNLSGL